MAYRVLIYEDNHRLRQSLEILLNDEQLFKVAGAFPDCNKAAEEVIGMAAELVVMDIDMPGIGGVEGVKQIKQAAPLTKVVMHTMFDDDNRIFDSICAGADGYLLQEYFTHAVDYCPAGSDAGRCADESLCSTESISVLQEPAATGQ